MYASKMSDWQHGDKVETDGDIWTVVNVGACRDGKTYLHLMSTTRVFHQKNGKRFAQIADWFASRA